MNFHHLRYFHAVAKLGTMSRAAAKLRVAQSAISVQIRQLEDDLGVPLFERQRSGLVLNEAGRIALDYAETIFRAGEELEEALRHKPRQRAVLRIGAVATLSRNFQMALLKPLLDTTEIVVLTGSLRELLVQLRSHALDVVLSNQAVPRDADPPLHSHLIDTQEVCIVSPPGARPGRFRFPADVDGCRMVLPGLESNVRVGFDAIIERAGVRPVVVAEADDMPMLRLLARETDALTLVPRVVVRDELKARTLVERSRVSDLRETFYAITPTRRFPNEVVARLLAS